MCSLSFILSAYVFTSPLFLKYTFYWILNFSIYSSFFLSELYRWYPIVFWLTLFLISTICNCRSLWYVFFLCFEDFPLYYWFSANWLWYILGFKCVYFFCCDSLSFSDLRVCSNSGSIYSRKMTELWHACSRALCCLTCLILAIFSLSLFQLHNSLQITVKISSLVVTGKRIMGLKFFQIPISRDLSLFDLSGGSSGRPHL